MSVSESLSDFFSQPERVTLENCDKEPIHLSGQIQFGCALLVVCKDTAKILAASDNCAAFFFFEPDALIGAELHKVDPELADLLASTHDDMNMHEVLEYEFKKDGIDYDVVTYQQGGHRLVEFLPNVAPSPMAARTKMRHCSKSCARIQNARDMEDAFQIAADAARKITGFARVNIYRFLPDWSGQVLAESRDEGALPSYLGLHFPTSDIPAQARAMMKIVPYRAIGTVEDATHSILADETVGEIDLTWSATRSVSTMHTQYLRNMGVAATFSTSLIHQDNLWGLIAAHHTEPGLIPFDSWLLMQEIGTALMLKYDQIERLQSASKINDLRKIENRFAAALRNETDLEGVIKVLIPHLRAFLNADGFAFQYGQNLHVCGVTPPKNTIRELTAWARNRHNDEDQYHSAALHREWATGKEHIETACGVLIQPIVVHRVCQLIWFRGPVARKVRWAGKPQKPLNGSRLEPRASFDLWVQEHREEAMPWTEAELNSAREVFTDFLDILASHLLLKEENMHLRHFAASAVHDIRAPLRGISAALDIMREENFDRSIVKETHSMAECSAKRLVSLSSGLMDLASISEYETTFAPTSIQAVIDDACKMLAHDILEARALITVDVPKIIPANEELLLRLFLNLIQNALKYRDAERELSISINVLRETTTFFEIAIADTGLGISPKHAEMIFKPLKRLHAQAEIEGAGLGLPICARIAEAHDGKIFVDPAYQGGARIVLRLPAPIDRALSA